MEFHPYIHSIATGGGLKNNCWVSCDKDYLLRSMFRNKFLYYLKHEFDNLILNSINDLKSFNKFLEPFYNKTWITYIEPPKSKAENVIEYVGSYAFNYSSFIKSWNPWIFSKKVYSLSFVNPKYPLFQSQTLETNLSSLSYKYKYQFDDSVVTTSSAS